MTAAAITELVTKAKKYTPAPAVEPVEPDPAPPFKLVPIADLVHAEPPAPAFAWEGLLPIGFVTLLGAHGGVGKTMVALMLAVCVCLGRPLFGVATKRGRVVFFSGEDGANLLRHRLRFVCRQMDVSPADLDGQLLILDATDGDPTLFAEVTTGGRREGITTATFTKLQEFVAGQDVRLVVVDNASDAFDANEIERARVRGFMRALGRLARDADAAVLLLAHVDKSTSRGERSGTEGYSGSTAWNNSARSRLFMSRNAEGGLLLEQQKHNLGPLREALPLEWPKGGLPQPEERFGPVVQGIADRTSERAILRLIAEFTERGEMVSTAMTSRTHAGKVLRQEATFPKLKDSEVFDLLRKAERGGKLVRTTYRGNDRKERERWDLTASGRVAAGLPAATAATAATSEVTARGAAPAEPAATAATAATSEVTARGAAPAEPAATAATSPLGGVGEKSAHIKSPQISSSPVSSRETPGIPSADEVEL